MFRAAWVQFGAQSPIVSPGMLWGERVLGTRWVFRTWGAMVRTGGEVCDCWGRVVIVGGMVTGPRTGWAGLGAGGTMQWARGGGDGRRGSFSFLVFLILGLVSIT